MIQHSWGCRDPEACHLCEDVLWDAFEYKVLLKRVHNGTSDFRRLGDMCSSTGYTHPAGGTGQVASVDGEYVQIAPGQVWVQG